MLFNSLDFLWFFPLIAVVYFSTPAAWRIVVLLAAGLWFYASWEPSYLLILFACIFAAHFGALAIDRSSQRRRTFWLVISMLIPFGMLLAFKYYNFFADTVQQLGRRIDSSFNPPLLRFALPVGISFFTFKTMSYLFDVHRGATPAEHSFLKTATYVSFFPQILAGPIERAGNFLPQLDRKHAVDAGRITDGLALMLWGLFKKAVIADNLAVVVNWVYLAPENYKGLPLIVATYTYAFQIYCDFSGYSDMAIGAARVLGFSTMKNFNRPYAATSVGEFWRRWHISLSTWFRDYVYIPLGGNRVALWKWTRNVMIVFLISGLWHGSYWTFIIWGGLHGLFLVGERLLTPAFSRAAQTVRLNTYPRVVTALRVGLTFNLVAFSWVFFRSETVGDALYITQHLFEGLDRGFTEALAVFRSDDLILAAILVAVLFTAQYIRRAQGALEWLRRRPSYVRWAVYAVLVLAIVNLRPEHNTGFIYLQF
ncbi:MAG: MBOAT family protein [Chitinivibrionales bacterium]|nr:MBOAT family protein [Chitinivibrionales bacterium]MBD3396822.1 MBOAT family protein [Chitinivibrionales bacterium]